MTADAVLFIQTIFTSVWSLFTSFNIPGTHSTPAEWALMILCLSVIIRFLRRLFGVSSDGGED